MKKEWFQRQIKSPEIPESIRWVNFGIGAVVLFIFITIIHYSQTELDYKTGSWLYAQMTTTSVALFGSISDLGDIALIFPVTFGLLIYFVWRRNWRIMAGLVSSICGGGAINYLLKILFQRPQIDLLKAKTQAVDFGFPSGHTVMSILFYGFLAFTLIANTDSRKWRWIIGLSAGMIVFLIGISRLLIGAHIPTDVLGGWVLGAIWLAISIDISNKIENWKHSQ
jgi:membrane-associated phospholipid phosphatase